MISEIEFGPRKITVLRSCHFVIKLQQSFAALPATVLSVVISFDKVSVIS